MLMMIVLQCSVATSHAVAHAPPSNAQHNRVCRVQGSPADYDTRSADQYFTYTPQDVELLRQKGLMTLVELDDMLPMKDAAHEAAHSEWAMCEEDVKAHWEQWRHPWPESGDPATQAGLPWEWPS